MDPDPWPSAPELPAPIIMDQRWTDAVFLHWRIPHAVAAPFMPPGVVPDDFDGSAWVGLIGFRMQGAGLGRGPGIPYFGSFNEINVRLYSREPDGTRGVVFLSLDATRLAVVLAARAAGIPYVWSRAGFRGAGDLDPFGFFGRRRSGQAGRGGACGGSGARTRQPCRQGRWDRPDWRARRVREPDTGCGASGAVPGATLRLPRSSTSKPPTRCPSTSRPGLACTPASAAGPCMFRTPTPRGRCTGRTCPTSRISWLPRPASASRDRPNRCSSHPGFAPSLAGHGSSDSGPGPALTA